MIIKGLLLGAAFLIAALEPAAAQLASRSDGIEIRAQLVAKRYTTLSSEVAARIDRIALHEGDAFKEGQLLVALDCSLQHAQLDEAKAELDAAEKTKAVNKRLLELRSGGVLDADLAIAQAAKAQAKMHSVQVVLSKCAITAPFSGRVVEQKVRDYQYVQPGQAMLDILDDSALEVEFIAPSRALAAIHKGTDFQVQLDETGETYLAKVTRIGAKVDAVSHSVKIVGEINGKSPAVIAGMSGRILLAPID